MRWLKITQNLTMVHERVEQFYIDIDSSDPTACSRWLTTDAEFAFNDVDPVSGAGPIGDFVGAWKSNFASVKHDVLGITADGEGKVAGIELRVHYEFPDGRVVSVRGCSFLDFRADRVCGWRVYVDTSRLV